jgi:hypothetical protein
MEPLLPSLAVPAATLRPLFASLAVDVPEELLPSLAVLAVPVPPALGVATGADVLDPEPFCPARLLPSLATREILPRLSTPLRSVVVAISEMPLPLPASALSADGPRTLG